MNEKLEDAGEKEVVSLLFLSAKIAIVVLAVPIFCILYLAVTLAIISGVDLIVCKIWSFFHK